MYKPGGKALTTIIAQHTLKTFRQPNIDVLNKIIAETQALITT